MEWSLEIVLIQVVLAVAMIVGFLYCYLIHQYDYWEKKYIPYLKPTFPFGNNKDVFLKKIDIGSFYEKFYKEFKSQKYVGMFELHRPTLIITDLDMVKQVLTKDFAYFVDHAIPLKLKHDYLLNHLFLMEGQEWKEMRIKLTPTFTSGKMKLMYSLIEKCTEQLKEHLEQFASKKAIINVKEVMSRFTINTIATCAFGVEVNTFVDSNSDFYEVSQLIEKQYVNYFKQIFILFFPWLANLFRMCITHPRVTSFILNLVDTTIKYREKNHVNRNDFLDLLIKIKNHRSLEDTTTTKTDDSLKDNLTLKEIAAQAYVFFNAGFETAASTTTFALYELAQNPDIQEKVRQEIENVMEKNGGQLTYQAIQEMTYMEQVVNETLRMYASLPFLMRRCVEPYKIPDTNATLDKGIKVVIPSYAIHHDPDLYPEPFKFDPERFSEENIKNRHNYAFLPFGEGPRMCIGMRFGKMQVKAALSMIVSNFGLTVTEDTPAPLEISAKYILTTPLNPIKLQITKRS